MAPIMTNVIKLVYDDDSEVYAQGAINGQFLGVSAADSGNADQPRAIIGEWNIREKRYDSREITTTIDANRDDDYDDDY